MGFGAAQGGVGGGTVVTLDDDVALEFGSSADASWLWETADEDANYLNLFLGGSRNLVISEDADVDWGHATSADPHVWIQSSDSGSVADYLVLYHDQTDANIDIGAGDLLLNIAGGNLAPDADDGWALGIASTGGVSDIFLASGAVLNFDNGDLTLTHSADVLALEGGDLGIGTASPLARLHIEEASAAELFRVRQAFVTKFIISNNGNVGVGSLLPVTNFHVHENNTDTVPIVELEQVGAGDIALQFSIAGDAYAIGIDNSDSDKFKISYANAAGTAVLGTNDRFVIDAAGNVGIGSITPTSILSLQMGTGTGVAEASGKANVNTTAVGTPASTVETDLITYSLPANSLSTNGQLIRITAWGLVAENGNTKTIRLDFGATTIRAIGPSGMNGLDWRIDGLVVRTGATTQDAMATESLDVSAQDTTITTPAETLSGAVVIKITGENGTAAANDIVAEGMLVEYLN